MADRKCTPIHWRQCVKAEYVSDWRERSDAIGRWCHEIKSDTWIIRPGTRWMRHLWMSLCRAPIVLTKCSSGETSDHIPVVAVSRCGSFGALWRYSQLIRVSCDEEHMYERYKLKSANEWSRKAQIPLGSTRHLWSNVSYRAHIPSCPSPIIVVFLRRLSIWFRLPSHR